LQRLIGRKIDGKNHQFRYYLKKHHPDWKQGTAGEPRG
jgi:hypothetical protein